MPVRTYRMCLQEYRETTGTPVTHCYRFQFPKPVWSLQFCSYKILQFMKQKISTASQTDQQYLCGLETEKINPKFTAAS